MDDLRLKHPEWVMMYRRGVTVDQIARINGATVRQVREYVGRIRRKYPQLLEGRLVLHDRPEQRPASLPDPDRRWKDGLAQYAGFVRTRGRRPGRGAGGVETRLAHWLTRQRSLHRLGRLPVHRARWLDRSVPDWRINDRTLAASPAHK